MTINGIIRTQRLPDNFFHICGSVYKVKLEEEVSFVLVIRKHGKITDIEPIELHSYLIDQSTQVSFNNNFESVARCLSNDTDFIHLAILLDKKLANSVI